MSTSQDNEQVAMQLMQVVYQHSRQQEYQKAVELALLAHQLAPNNVQILSDISTYYIFLHNWLEAIKYALLCISIEPGLINAYHALAHAFGELRDWKQCGHYGHQILDMMDKVIMHNFPNPPKLPEKPNPTNKQNLLSFSLYGNSSAYIETAILNAQLTKDFYPGWVSRFYVDETVPKQAIERLEEAGAQIIYADDKMKKLPATMWRFLAIDDPELGYVVFRDADAVISLREAKTVQEWIDSGQRFQTIRDASSHTELIMAGLWGAIAGSIPNFTEKMYDYAQSTTMHPRFADQYFLREHIWIYIRQDLYASDRIFHFGDSHPITHEGENYDIYHIGCDEGGFCFNLSTGLEDGQAVIWELYSQISPLPHEDLSPRYTAERLICSYPAEVRNGAVAIYMPRRYGDGLTNGTTRVILRVAES